MATNLTPAQAQDLMNYGVTRTGANGNIKISSGKVKDNPGFIFPSYTNTPTNLLQQSQNTSLVPAEQANTKTQEYLKTIQTNPAPAPVNTGNTVDELGAKYREESQAQNAALMQRYNDLLKQSYDYTAGKLKNATDNNLRELYIKNQQEQTALPERLARAGINGGAVETTLANLNAGYQSGRNKARSDYMSQLADIGNNYNEKLADRAISQDERTYDNNMKLYDILLNQAIQRENSLYDSQLRRDEAAYNRNYDIQDVLLNQAINQDKMYYEYLLDIARLEKQKQLERGY